MPNYFQILRCITKLWVGHEQVPLKSMHKSLSVDCDFDFDQAIWFLFATQCLVIMIICAKLFSNPTMHNKVMGRTRTGFTEVYAQSLSADYLCQIIFKSHHIRLSYGSDTILDYTNTQTHTHTHTHTHTG